MADLTPTQGRYLAFIHAKLDDLRLTTERCFGHWFDFGDDWYHPVHVEKIDQAIRTVKYPRATKRVGKSPPQYPRE